MNGLYLQCEGLEGVEKIKIKITTDHQDLGA